jgi:anti-sigma regulatory factor (Ser/Thr protein kinase)
MDHPAPCDAHVHLRLPVEVESVAAAHHSVLDLGRELGPALGDVRLLISELVTNAIRHAGLDLEDWIELDVEVGSNTVRVEVRDHGTGFEPAMPPASKPLDGAGWGLRLVHRVASRWGVERDAWTRVWFEIDLDLRIHDGKLTPKGHG